MSDDLQAAGEAAAQAAAQAQPPASPAEEPVPEGDTFDRAYVEKLRAEAASYRTKLREFENAFDGYEEQERETFLSMASDLSNNPARAHERFQGVVNRLANQLGISKEDATAVAEAQEKQPGGLTAEQVEALVAKQVADAQQATTKKANTQRIFDEAAAIDERYAVGSDQLAQLIHVAKSNPEAGGTLEGAHAILKAREDAIREQAIKEYREGLTTGAAYPPVIEGRDPATPGGPLDWSKVENPLEVARQRAEERFRAAFGE